MQDQEQLYQIIYALAAQDGRQEALFGTCQPLASIAFSRSVATEALPELWFEIPLLGKPWFDLHALTSLQSVRPGTAFKPETTGNNPEAFEWFASQNADCVRQLALSWDVSSNDISNPAIQLLVASRKGYASTCEFLEAAHRPDAVPAYRRFIERLPEGWFACYTGVFPGRLGENVRVECVLSNDLQRAYADDGALLEQHLKQLGYSETNENLVQRCQLLARTPFKLEFQFDVTPTGTASSTFSASLRFNTPPGSQDWHAFESTGAGGELMKAVESWGLADSRWRLLQNTTYAKRVTHDDEQAVIYCYPAFVKLRWRKGEPFDAKAYLIAGEEVGA